MFGQCRGVAHKNGHSVMPRHSSWCHDVMVLCIMPVGWRGVAIAVGIRMSHLSNEKGVQWPSHLCDGRRVQWSLAPMGYKECMVTIGALHPWHFLLSMYLHIDHWSVAPMDGKRVQPWSLGHHTGGMRAWRGPQWLSGHHTHRMVAITVTIGAAGQWE